MLDEKVFNRLEKSAISISDLFGLVEELKSEDLSQLQILVIFDEYRAFLDNHDREAEYNNVLDTMDCIYGWCIADARLFEHVLSNEEIAKYRQNNNL